MKTAAKKQGSELITENLGPDLLNAVGFIYSTEVCACFVVVDGCFFWQAVFVEKRLDDCEAVSVDLPRISLVIILEICVVLYHLHIIDIWIRNETWTRFKVVNDKRNGNVCCLFVYFLIYFHFCFGIKVDVMSQQRAAEEIVQHQENNDVFQYLIDERISILDRWAFFNICFDLASIDFGRDGRNSTRVNRILFFLTCYTYNVLICIMKYDGVWNDVRLASWSCRSWSIIEFGIWNLIMNVEFGIVNLGENASSCCCRRQWWHVYSIFVVCLFRWPCLFLVLVTCHQHLQVKKKKKTIKHHSFINQNQNH